MQGLWARSPCKDGSVHVLCCAWSISRVQLFGTPWAVAHQAPLSMGFSRQEYWSGLPVPSSRGSSQPRDWTQVSCIAGRFFTLWATREGQKHWSGWPTPSPGDLPSPGIEPVSPALQVDFFFLFFTSWATREPGGCSYWGFNPSPWEKQHGTSEMGLPVWMLITLHPKSAFPPNFPADKSKSLHCSASLSGSLELKD